MLQNRRLGAALVILGVLANNYVYWHDVILGKYENFEGAIVLGWLATVLILATLAIIALGLGILWRASAAPSLT